MAMPIARMANGRMRRAIAPATAIIVRSRYHVRRWELELAGAQQIMDEEELVGLRIAAALRRYLPRPGEPAAGKADEG